MRPYNVAPLPRYSSCRMGCNLLQWPAEHTYGVLAHLVERFHGMEEVGGSNPPYSTIIARFTALGYKPKAVLYGIWYGAVHSYKQPFNTHCYIFVKSPPLTKNRSDCTTR